MQRIAGFLLVAVIAASLAWWMAADGRGIVIGRHPAQQVQAVIEGDSEQTVLSSNLQPGETQEQLIRRHLSLYMEWRRIVMGGNSDASDSAHEVDDRRGSSGAHVSSLDGERGR